MTGVEVPGGRRRRYDVVVAGGGPAGASAAITLARAGRSVLLADAGGGPPSVGEALPGAARVLLADLGVGEHVPGPGHLTCYATLSAWGSARPTTVSAIHDPNGPGRHLDRPLFDRRLRDGARAAGAEVVEHTPVGAPVRRPDGTWSVPLGRPGRREVVGCDWVVDATGRRATVATGSGGARRHTHDALVALHLTLADPTEPDTDASTLVESGADGWWYTALLPGDRRLVVYFTDADLPAARAGDPARFRALLAETSRVGRRLAGWPLPAHAAPRRAPAHGAHLDRVCGAGWIAVGDAAAAFDPLSAQGILSALYTGLTAGHTVDACLAGRRDAPDVYRARLADLLRAYRRNHRDAYAAERRWSDHPFWQRRHLAPPQSEFEPTSETEPTETHSEVG
ncbi:NAD(P)/FAD-dependent oxidoreductase [Embleya sp. NPDC050493]|uniref:NAD(P)/FAD-dependent oxidoreductase n=1 Tax=Embleya sp. NPDC050493 TaxID=3363989 RepID=UPI0037AED7AB